MLVRQAGIHGDGPIPARPARDDLAIGTPPLQRTISRIRDCAQHHAGIRARGPLVKLSRSAGSGNGPSCGASQPNLRLPWGRVNVGCSASMGLSLALDRLGAGPEAARKSDWFGVEP